MTSGISPRAIRPAWLLAWLILIAIAVGMSVRGQSSGTAELSFAGLASVSDGSKAPSESATPTGRYGTTIHGPLGPPVIELPQADPQGRTGKIACSTCHSLREADRKTNDAADLQEFHQDLAFDHGKLACYACHSAQNADTLHLADGSAIEYADVMTLCAQCHGTQARDYQHGAHGGMNGYWDLSRGPRTRNHCVDCHDPHAPQFPRMIPTFKPRDRFLEANEPHSLGATHD